MPNRFESNIVPAALVLADGTVFAGHSIGGQGTAVGEVVFHTGMTGYQEILTDPSYCRQIVTLTYPHIGNTGANDEDMESAAVQAEGVIVRELPIEVSNWRSQRSLAQLLGGRPGLAGIDTRRLSRLLRDRGAQNGCLIAAAEPGEKLDIALAQHMAREFAGLAGMDLAQVVSTKTAYPWRRGVWSLSTAHRPQAADEARGLVAASVDDAAASVADVAASVADVAPAAGVHADSHGVTAAAVTTDERNRGAGANFRVVAYDFGIKHNILRLLVERGCEVTVVPARTTAQEALAMRPDGIFLSNGPGDPEPCDYAIEATREFLERSIPLFGICLGHQFLALASGARTMKMRFGHHGANHPVQDVDSGQVFITSQNHGFTVDPDSLPATLRVTHRSLFDGSIQGLARTDRPAYAFQGHPEASPGPCDVNGLFDRFIELMRGASQR